MAQAKTNAQAMRAYYAPFEGSKTVEMETISTIYNNKSFVYTANRNRHGGVFRENRKAKQLRAGLAGTDGCDASDTNDTKWYIHPEP